MAFEPLEKGPFSPDSQRRGKNVKPMILKLLYSPAYRLQWRWLDSETADMAVRGECVFIVLSPCPHSCWPKTSQARPRAEAIFLPLQRTSNASDTVCKSHETSV